MGIINIYELSFHYTGSDILKDINLEINKGDKIGLIGANGSGKTTLLKLICGELKPVSGSIYMQKDLSVGYLSQSAVLNDSRSVYEEALSAFDHLIGLEKFIYELSSHIDVEACESKRDELVRKLSNANDEYMSSGGAAYINRTKSVLKGLGFLASQFEVKTCDLSAGQKTRLRLARLLLEKHDMLMLDEPTNHLDFDSISWLEGFVKSSDLTVVCVSHDRYFLDEVTTKTAEIENASITVYPGAYSASRAIKAQSLYADERAYKKQRSEIKHIKEVITKLKQFNREKSIKRARSFEKKLEKIEQVKKPVTGGNSVHIEFSKNIKKSHDILTVDALSKSYGSLVLFSDLSFSLYNKNRLFVIGPNGSGKSTLLKILTGSVTADIGTFKTGPFISTGYFDQDQRFDDPDKSVFNEIYDSFPGLTVGQITSVLAGMLFFGDDLKKRIADISGGEKSRLALLKLILSNPDFLILDEPTNHLDLFSRERLEEALLDYEGTLLVVSHDRYFISRLAKSILFLDNGTYKFYRDGFDEYLAEKAVEAKADLSTNQDISAGKAAFIEAKKKQSGIRKLESDIQKIKTQIHETEKHIVEIENKLNAANDTHDYEALMEFTKLKDEKETWLLLALDKAACLENKLKEI